MTLICAMPVASPIAECVYVASTEPETRAPDERHPGRLLGAAPQTLASAPLLAEWLARTTAARSHYTSGVYRRALLDYGDFLRRIGVEADVVGIGKIQRYIEDWRERRRVVAPASAAADSAVSCAAALRVRLTALRDYYDLLTRERRCLRNPLRASGVSLRALALGRAPLWPVGQRPRTIPPPHRSWIPSRDEMLSLRRVMARASARDRFMVALIFDAQLSARAVCALRCHDLSRRSRLTVPASRAGRLRPRVIRLRPSTTRLAARHMPQRSGLALNAPLFCWVSDTRTAHTGRTSALTLFAVQKVIGRIASAADVQALTIPALRRLRGLIEQVSPLTLCAITGQSQLEHPDCAPSELFLRALFGRGLPDSRRSRGVDRSRGSQRAPRHGRRGNSGEQAIQEG